MRTFWQWIIRENDFRTGAKLGLYPDLADALSQTPPLYGTAKAADFITYLYSVYGDKGPYTKDGYYWPNNIQIPSLDGVTPRYVNVGLHRHQMTESLDNDYYYRYVHNNGMGLMNNQAIDYQRLSDDEEAAVDHGYLALQRPSGVPRGAIFVFTADGVKRHAKLIKLLKKASRYGVRGVRIDPSKYEVVWQSSDGQLALLPV